MFMKKTLRRVGSFLLVVAMLMAVMPAAFAADQVTVYLHPSSNWLEGNARFAVYYFNAGQGWVSMSDAGGGFYSASVPAGATVIFCRMNPENTTNDWSNKWNQTGDLAIPTDGSNCFYVPEGTWDGAGSSNWGTMDTAPDVEEPVFTGYTVAGSGGLCGAEWDPAQNTMTETSDGIWEITFTGIAAGTYEFKVTDGTWSNSWGEGSGNVSVTLAEQGDVTVIFNAETEEITVKINGEAVEDEDGDTSEVTYTVAGEEGLCGVSWDPAQNAMTETADGIWEITFEGVAAGTYKFKVTDGTWNNSWGDGEYDKVITVPVDGDVIVTFNAETKEISVDLPEVADFAYTVAGEEGLCGVSWDPAQNAMTETADGIWEITFEGVAAGTYKFKVTDGTWNNSWGEGEYDKTVTLEADGDVTVTFNADTKEITVSVSAAAPAQYTVTIHFLPDSSWGSSIKAWLWMNDNDNIPGYEDYHKTWPGKAIEANADHEGWYDLTVVTEEASGFKYIFNDGSNQTADLHTGMLTGDAEFWLVGQSRYDTAPEEWTGVPTYNYTVYFHNADNWENIHAYAWADDGTKFLGEWPGTEAEPAEGNEGWYMVSFSCAYDQVNIIFNGTGSQTADLAVASQNDERNVQAWIDSNSVSYTEPEGWAEVQKGNTVKIHFMAPYTSWGDTIYAWLWNGGSDVPGYEEYHKEWPGMKVESDHSNPGWYYLEVTTELSGFNFIFSGKRQTADLHTGQITGDMEIWVYGNDIYNYKPDVLPATGDDANLGLFAGMMILSVLALGAVVIGRKKLSF